MPSPTTDSYGELARELMVKTGVPAAIADTITWTDAQTVTATGGWTFTLTPGCSQPLGLGVACVWGHFDLRGWLAAAPDSVYHYNDTDLAVLSAIAADLQDTNEGGQTIWGASVLEPDDLRPRDRYAPLFVDTLIYHCAAPLPEDTITATTGRIAAASWGLIAANKPAQTDTGPCYATEWAYGV